MFKLKPIVVSVTCVFIAGGCASLNSPDKRAMSVKPVTHVRHSGGNPGAMYQLGRFFQGQSRHELAIDAYREALEQAPNLIEADNALGVIYAQQGRYNDAVTELEAAIALAPGAAHLHNNLGYAYLLAGKNAEAVAALEQANRLDPANKRAIANLRLAYDRTGNQQKVPELERAVEIKTAASASDLVAEQEPAQSSSALQLVTVAPNVYEIKQPTPRIRVGAASAANTEQVSAKTPFGLEVSNGNGVAGMARRVAGFLRQSAIGRARLTNEKPFTRQATQIEYRHGFQQEASGVNSWLPRPAPLVQVDRLREGINVRLVLGKDLSGDVASFSAPTRPAQVASNI